MLDISDHVENTTVHGAVLVNPQKPIQTHFGPRFAKRLAPKLMVTPSKVVTRHIYIHTNNRTIEWSYYHAEAHSTVSRASMTRMRVDGRIQMT